MRVNRHNILAQIHKLKKPSVYLEIGTLRGKSLQLANCYSIAIDPDFKISAKTKFTQHVDFFEMTSDEFFEKETLKQKPDLVFIDGLHLIEQVLKDFINVEKNSHKGTMVVFDDVLPDGREQCNRKRPPQPQPWVGDVWKIIPILQQYRSDLRLTLLYDEFPGLLLVTGLDFESAVLANKYDEIIREYKNKEFDRKDFYTLFKKLKVNDLYS